MISEHTLLALVIRTLLILVAGVGCAVILYRALYGEPFRNRLDGERWPHYESVSCFGMVAFGIFISYHFGMHGGLFRCKFPECESTAMMWMVLYSAALQLQPIAAIMKKAPYNREGYLRWGSFAIAFWLICYIAGKALWVHVHWWFVR